MLLLVFLQTALVLLVVVPVLHTQAQPQLTPIMVLVVVALVVRAQTETKAVVLVVLRKGVGVALEQSLFFLVMFFQQIYQ